MRHLGRVMRAPLGSASKFWSPGILRALGEILVNPDGPALKRRRKEIGWVLMNPDREEVAPPEGWSSPFQATSL